MAWIKSPIDSETLVNLDHVVRIEHRTAAQPSLLLQLSYPALTREFTMSEGALADAKSNLETLLSPTNLQG